MSNHLRLASLALVALASVAASQTCPIVIDLNTNLVEIQSSNPGDLDLISEQEIGPLTGLGGNYLFAAETIAVGIELFTTDGTAAGTNLLVDINALGSSKPNSITPAGWQVYFMATDPQNGSLLRVLDNSPLGYKIITDSVGLLDHGEGPIAAFGNKLLFRGFAADGSHALWITDGTAAGTSPITGPAPLNLEAEPDNFHIDSSGTRAFFTARNFFPSAEELFITDGTAAGTVQLVINTFGGGNNAAENLVNLNGLVYFSANDSTHGRELWVSDGTKAGTHILVDIYQGVGQSYAMASGQALFGNELYFSANDGVSGEELWKTDGTVAGTVQVADINPGPLLSAPADFTVVGSQLFFSATDTTAFGGVHGRELFAVDLAGQVQLVKDIAPGTADALDSLAQSAKTGGLFTAVGNKLAFVADDGLNGRELWVSDGTDSGTHMVRDIGPGSLDSDPRRLTALDANTLLFAAEDDTHGRELWISDLTAQGTQLVIDIESHQLTASSYPRRLTSPNGIDVLFFATPYPTLDGLRKLMKYSPTTGMTILATVSPVFDSEDLRTFWLGDKLLTFFSGRTQQFDDEPWVTDGSPAGTMKLKDLIQGPSGSKPKHFTQLGDKVLFAARQQSVGIELFITDGTPGGTQLLKNINLDNSPTGSADSNPKELVEFNGRVYFAATSGSAGLGQELWSTDGTAAGTSLFIDINPGPANSFPHKLFIHNGKLHFYAFTSATGYKVWSTDGTLAGTGLTTETGLEFGFKKQGLEYVKVDGVLYYSQLTQPALGVELWRSDGTPAGTFMVKDLNPGDGSSQPRMFLPANGGFYFIATTGEPKDSLWFSDGTPIGTQVICASTDTGASPIIPHYELILADGKLMLSAHGPYVGNEFFELPLSGAYVTELGPNGDKPVLTANAPQFGSTLNVACDRIPMNSVSVLAISAPTDALNNNLASYGNASWIDPASASVLGIFPGTAWTWNTQVPLNPTLAGLRLNMQVYALPGASFPAVTSNGLSMLVGN